MTEIHKLPSIYDRSAVIKLRFLAEMQVLKAIHCITDSYCSLVSVSVTFVRTHDATEFSLILMFEHHSI